MADQLKTFYTEKIVPKLMEQFQYTKEEIRSLIMNIFNGCLDQCAPVVTREITRPFAPWIDQDLKNIISEKNSLQLRLKNDRSNHILDSQFKEKKKNVEKLLYIANRSHFKEKFNKSKGNGRATWKTAGEMIPGLNLCNSID